MTIKNQFLALSIAPHVLRQLSKTIGQWNLDKSLPRRYPTLLMCTLTWISVHTPQILDTNSLFEINLDRQLPKDIIPLDVLHSINHKQPHELIIPLLNMAPVDVKLLKNTV